MSCTSLVRLSLVLGLLGANQPLAFCDDGNDEGPVVETKVGTIRGLHEEDGDYSMFLGIPYARVNESNPFGVSSPQPVFSGIFQAVDDSIVCPQQEEFNNTITGSLDCLTLNVFVPNVASTSKLPVMVWIHGGGYQSGFANRYVYGAKFFMKQEVILVTVNYRMGPYGFMCLDIPEVPGNQGLRDQMLALRWVKENIDAFNGDENKITLMGESAGAISVEFHLQSSFEPYYNQVILQSGSTLITSLLTEPNPQVPFIIAEQLGFVTDDVSEALAFLARCDTDVLMAAYVELGMELVVCVEHQFENVEGFVTKHPEFSDMPKAKDMPVLTGFNKDELMMAFADLPSLLFLFMSNIFEEMMSTSFVVDNDFDEMVDVARRFYVGDQRMTEALRWDLIEYASDLLFIHPVQRSVVRFRENSAKVYQYMFSYSGGRNYFKMLLGIAAEGAAHADELGYLFDMEYIPSVPSDADQLVIDGMTTMWANFAKYGDPTPNRVSNLLPVKWPSVTSSQVHYINIDSELSVGTRPLHNRMAFWDLFYETNHDKLLAYQEGFSRKLARKPWMKSIKY